LELRELGRSNTLSKKPRSKVDIGLVWAKYVNTWGQVGAVAGTANLIMMLGVFYTTTLRPAIEVPLWLYILVVVVAAITGVLFVLKVGISGYYRFFSKQSEVAETNLRVQENDRKLTMIMSKLGIEDNGKESQ
jgi:hypothetical protein